MQPTKQLFNNKELWEKALTHRSYLNEVKGGRANSNERLEFLGDAVLALVVSKWLYQSFPGFPEGELTNLRSQLVKTETLAEVAQKWELGRELKMSRGERESGGNKNRSLLADSVEAIIGAVFLDQGMGEAEELILSNWQPILTRVISRGELKDSKSRLQEKVQVQSREAPKYRVLKAVGPDHAKTFTVGVFHQKRLLAEGQGGSKQTAEEAAAKSALEKIGVKK